jgi:glyoxylate reductase
MKNYTVFITRDILEEGPNLLKNNGLSVDIFSGEEAIDKETLYQKAKQADALITMLTDPIDEAFLKANKHLKVISNYAVGFNNIDVFCATELGIAIGNTPDVLTNATAELALGLMISTARNFSSATNSVRIGKWQDWHPTNFLGPELTHKTLGIIGMGRIGSRLAEIAKSAFNMKIMDSKSFSLEEIYKNADFISLHVPLNEKTRNMIGLRDLSLMKPTAILINTARGEVINQDDLIHALENKIIWGAGLDVTTPEPLPLDSKLLNLNNIIITPHIGSASFEARRSMSLLCAENILQGLKKEKLKGFVNPLVFKM